MAISSQSRSGGAHGQAPKPVHQMTERQFEAMFPHEEACAAYLVARRWPKGVHCPRCGNPRSTDAGDGISVAVLRLRADQRAIASRISPGPFLRTPTSRCRDWFKVIHLMLTSKKGMSALQIQRHMGFGSYKTAWCMCHRIRAALIEPETKLGGIVEVDETCIGGKDKNKHVTSAAKARQASALHQDADHRRGAAQGQRGRPRARCVSARTMPQTFRPRGGVEQG